MRNLLQSMNKITFEDFQKLDIRIATILEAEIIPDTAKLLKLKIDLGYLNISGQPELRILVAGIGTTYKPEDLIGKQIPILANLKPKIIKGIESNGMILAVDVENKAILMYPDKSVPSGAKIR
jgi:methionine--tRNA ligase beta chain